MTIFKKISSLFGKIKQKDGTQTARFQVDKSVLLDKIRQSDLFKDLPPENLEEMFSHMETVEMRDGETIIREGEEGDYYYLLLGGTAEVTRRLQRDGKSEVVAVLREPTGFGEEALISNAKRNATVTMTSNGAIMRLSKDSFNDYVKEPMVTWCSPMEAQDKISKGAKWIDVRDPDDARQAHLHGALSMPMEELRDSMSQLDKDIFYICYCQNGRLSSTAAFLLRQQDYNVGVLRGGLLSLKQAGIA